MDKPNLGLATTRELIEELIARMEVQSYSGSMTSTEHALMWSLDVFKTTMTESMLDYKTVS